MSGVAGILPSPAIDRGVDSFDDGPSPYTPKLVNYLHDHNITATFFVVGSRVISRPDMLQTEYMLGHQMCVFPVSPDDLLTTALYSSDHTWSHTPLSMWSCAHDIGARC